MPKGVPINLVGERFGAWTVLSQSPERIANQVYWNCRCDCGKDALVVTGNLRQKKSTRCRSCGNRRGGNARWDDVSKKERKET